MINKDDFIKNNIIETHFKNPIQTFLLIQKAK